MQLNIVFTILGLCAAVMESAPSNAHTDVAPTDHPNDASSMQANQSLQETPASDVYQVTRKIDTFRDYINLFIQIFHLVNLLATGYILYRTYSQKVLPKDPRASETSQKEDQMIVKKFVTRSQNLEDNVELVLEAAAIDGDRKALASKFSTSDHMDLDALTSVVSDKEKRERVIQEMRKHLEISGFHSEQPQKVAEPQIVRATQGKPYRTCFVYIFCVGCLWTIMHGMLGQDNWKYPCLDDANCLEGDLNRDGTFDKQDIAVHSHVFVITGYHVRPFLHLAAHIYYAVLLAIQHSKGNFWNLAEPTYRGSFSDPVKFMLLFTSCEVLMLIITLVYVAFKFKRYDEREFGSPDNWRYLL